MSDEPLLEDPTNRVVSVFDDRAQADAARREFMEAGVPDEQVRVLHGEDAAAHVDTTPKWFADTDVDIKRYEQALEAGSTVVSVPIADGNSRERVHAILRRHGARLITHFGEWVTEVMK